MTEPHLSVSVIYTVRVLLNDDTLPGPYDPSEYDFAFATWFDLRPVMGGFLPPLRLRHEARRA